MSDRLRLFAEYFLLLLFTGFLIVKGVVPAWRTLHSDFGNYYVSARLVADGVPLDKLYDNQWFQEQIRLYDLPTPGKFSPYPPLSAWIMTPLTVFTALTAQRVFTCFNLLMIGACIILFNRVTLLKIHHCAVLILGCGLGLVNNIAFGQVYLVMVVCILFSFLLFERNMLPAAGSLMGFFTVLKYFPLVFIVGFLLNGNVESRFRKNKDLYIAIYSLLAAIILFLIQIPFFGKTVVNEFIQSSFLPHLDGDLSGQNSYSFYFQSWDSLFRNLFVYHREFNPEPFIRWSYGRTFFKLIIALLILASLLMILWKCRRAPNPARRSVFLSLPALAVMAILPASASYHQILLLVPLALILKDELLEKRMLTVALIVYFLLGFIPYGLAFSLAKSWGVFFAYPRLMLLTLLYLLVLVGMYRNTGLLPSPHK